jgi:hypothetical protein
MDEAMAWLRPPFSVKLDIDSVSSPGNTTYDARADQQGGGKGDDYGPGVERQYFFPGDEWSTIGAHLILL